MADEQQMEQKKEKIFRGQTLEDLQKLEVREFSKLLKSRPRRAILRNFSGVQNFIIRCQKKMAKKKIPRTHKRDLVIVPAMVGMTIGVHNGKEFTPVIISMEMLGHRLGEFAMTRKFTKHGAAGVGATKSSAALSVK